MAATTFTVSSIYESAKTTSSFIKSKLPEHLSNPQIGIICGSGLGGLADTVDPETKYEIEYKDIPGFTSSTVAGHAGKLTIGLLGEKWKTVVVLMVGRSHFYEGHSIDKVTFPVRVLKLLGIETLVVTNAAGGLNPNYNVGDIVVLNDHINFPGLAGAHPLRGPNVESFGTRFPALSDAYDLQLRRNLHVTFKRLITSSPTFLSSSSTQADVPHHEHHRRRRLHEGVYAFVSGPSFETRAECRMLKLLGADLVGMSTVPEIVVARHAGIRILALSLVTNCAVLDPPPRGDVVLVEEWSGQGGKSGKIVVGHGKDLNKVIEIGKATHAEVLEAGRKAARDLQELVTAFVDDLVEEGNGAATLN